MPNSSTITSKPYVLTLEGTENIIVDDFQNLKHVIQTSPENGLLPEVIFLLFTSKREQNCNEASDPLCNQAEKAIIDYLSYMSDSRKQNVKLVHCRMKEEELHLLSLNKIFPWCILENIKVLPALMRLDGLRILYKEDLCNCMKLDLIFSQTKEHKKPSVEYSSNIEPKPRSLVLNLRRDVCSFHGQVKRPDYKLDYVSDNEDDEGEVENENRTGYRNDRLGKILFVNKRKFQVQRKPLVEPVVEPPPEPPILEKKPKKKGKGKGKGKKGKGKKGKK